MNYVLHSVVFINENENLRDVQLVEQEEQLRRDEESFYEAKREAARVAAKLRMDEQATRDTVAAAADNNWAPADEWEM